MKRANKLNKEGKKEKLCSCLSISGQTKERACEYPPYLISLGVHVVMSSIFTCYVVGVCYLKILPNGIYHRKI
jgi:hypothetical protein